MVAVLFLMRLVCCEGHELVKHGDPIPRFEINTMGVRDNDGSALVGVSSHQVCSARDFAVHVAEGTHRW